MKQAKRRPVAYAISDTLDARRIAKAWTRADDLASQLGQAMTNARAQTTPEDAEPHVVSALGYASALVASLAVVLAATQR